MSAFVSWQSGKRTLKNGDTGSTDIGTTTTPTQIWSNDLKDESDTVGLTSSHRGLMGGKMEIVGTVSYSLDKSTYSTQVPYDATCSTAGVLSCGSLPAIKNEVVTLKLTDNYQIDKNSKIALGYTYQHRSGVDYYYNGLQYGNTPGIVMPTNQQFPSYAINVVTGAYVYNF